MLTSPQTMNRQLADLTLPELYDAYNDCWAARAAALASYHNAIREHLPELIDRYQLQVLKLNRTADEIMEEINRRSTCAQ